MRGSIDPLGCQVAYFFNVWFLGPYYVTIASKKYVWFLGSYDIPVKLKNYLFVSQGSLNSLSVGKGCSQWLSAR